MIVYVIVGSIQIWFNDDVSFWIDSVWYNKVEAEERVKKLDDAYKSRNENILKEVDYNSWENNRYNRNPNSIDYIEFDIEEEIIQGKINE